MNHLSASSFMHTRLAVACDHRGLVRKTELLKWLRQHMPYLSVHDYGCFHEQNVDYTDFITHVAKDVLTHDGFGLLICSTGFGMCIGANRHIGIRAAVCRTAQETLLARQHNHINVLVLGARFTTTEEAQEALIGFLKTPPDLDDRHQRRVKALDHLCT